tara:strand:- start:852 stop:1850 length:999 start_codon:yes stop_codon:yes gene_type:complete
LNKNNQHFYSLDLFRAVAGYGVAVCHFYYYIFDNINFQFYSIFFVEFFFVLSGFVLYPQLIKVYENKKNLKIFFIRRWMRTIPLYLLALLCYSIIFAKFDFDTLKYTFFIQKLTSNFLTYDYFSVAWSLSVEEIFYIIFPLFLVIFNKRNIFQIIIIFLSFIYFLKILYITRGDIDNEFFRVATFLRLDAIAFGLVIRENLLFIKKIKFHFFLGVALFLIIYFIENISLFNKYELFIFILILQIFSINIMSIFLFLDRFIKKNYLKKIFSLLSKQTYSVYLLHLLPIYFLKKNEVLINQFWLFLIYIFFLFFISTLSYYLFEKPILTKRPNY